jgi:hypothetical protein
VVPDNSGQAEWVVKETHDFHFRDELADFVEERE